MKAIILIVSSLLGFVTAPAWAAPYERNTARPVDQVVFGQVDTVRNITQRQVLESEHTGWKTLGGAVLGGLLGNQFGGGHWRGTGPRPPSSTSQGAAWWRTSWWSC